MYSQRLATREYPCTASAVPNEMLCLAKRWRLQCFTFTHLVDYLWSNVVNSEWGHRGHFEYSLRDLIWLVQVCLIRFWTKLYRNVALQEQNWTPLAYMIFDLLPHDYSSSQALLSRCFISLAVYLAILFSFPLYLCLLFRRLLRCRSVVLIHQQKPGQLMSLVCL